MDGENEVNDFLIDSCSIDGELLFDIRSISQESDEGSCVPQGPFVDTNKIVPLLNCPVCTEDLLPPIYQCREGHTLCNHCREKIRVCPTCQTGAIDIRCRGLDALAESLGMVSCRYRADGCLETVEYLLKKQHESTCSFMPIRCLHDDSECAFQGLSDKLVEHLVGAHSYVELKTNQISFTCHDQPRNQPGSVLFGENQIYSCASSHFLLRVNYCVAEEKLSFNISLVELASTDRSTRCHLKVKLLDGKEREYTYEGPVWSMERLSNSVKLPRDSMLIPGSFGCSLSAFKNLQITGEIFQHEWERQQRQRRNNRYDAPTASNHATMTGSFQQQQSNRNQPQVNNNARNINKRRQSRRGRGWGNRNLTGIDGDTMTAGTSQIEIDETIDVVRLN